jgi:cytochrome c-type biogenesis protein CcmH/NrfG
MIRLSQNNLQRAFQDFVKVLEVASPSWSHRLAVEQHLIDLRKRLDAPD